MSASAHDRAEKTPTRYHRRYSLRAPYPIAAPTGTAPNASNAFSLLWLLPACDLRLSVFVAWILRFASLRKATIHVRIFWPLWRGDGQAACPAGNVKPFHATPACAVRQHADRARLP